jgi:hypothetical protein
LWIICSLVYRFLVIPCLLTHARILRFSLKIRIRFQGAGQKVIEKRTHRYDTAGNPVSQQVVREEEHLLPDGTRQKTTTVYESDINGRMNEVERIIENTKKVGNVTRSTTTAERPDINKRFKVYERAESERTQQSDAVATEKSSRKVDNGLGTMIEVERTESAMNRAGDTATTETKV